MKFILEIVLSTIIIFFVWNILKKIFFNYFYKKTGLGSFFNNLNQQNQQEESRKNTNNKKKEIKVKWDAETVDYEEIKEK